MYSIYRLNLFHLLTAAFKRINIFNSTQHFLACVSHMTGKPIILETLECCLFEALNINASHNKIHYRTKEFAGITS